MFHLPLAVRLFPLVMLAGCGTYVPHQQEFWDGPPMTSDLEYRIKAHIFCETIAAIRYVNDVSSIKDASGNTLTAVIPSDWGVQMQIALTVEETGALNPSATSVSLNPTVALGATFSSTAARTDTSYSYYNVGKIAGPGKNEAFCRSLKAASGSSPLLQSELGIKEYLLGATEAEIKLRSSDPPQKGDVKLDIYSYEIKFAVVSSGNANLSWTLTKLTTNTAGSPLFGAGRTRTHDLTLTFAPGANGPSFAALQTHFNSQIVQSNQRRPPF